MIMILKWAFIGLISTFIASCVAGVVSCIVGLIKESEESEEEE